MRLLPIFLSFVVILMKYTDAGVITSTSGIRNNNNIDTGKYVSNNEIPEELSLQRPITPKKYWMSKNIPLFKKIPKGLAKYVNKHSETPNIFYKELYGIKKIEAKVKTRLDNIIKSDVKLQLNNASLLLTDPTSAEGQIDKKNNNMNHFEEAVEISLSEDNDTTEDILNVEQEMEDDNKNLLKEFIQSHTVIPTKSDCHSDSSEEQKDLDEFIFMINSQGPWEDVVDESVEMTTQVIDAKPRDKRRVNIIEEENMGSTVPGFKFTGQDISLNNELFYKNINS